MYHVIIVEDDPMVAFINRQYLQSDPLFVLDQTFTNGKDAIRYLETHKVDLTVVDYYMPLMNGMDFVKACRARGIDTYLVMITAANSADDFTTAISNGVMDYIVKPFSFERFQETLVKFKQVHKMKGSSARLSQEEIDQLMARRAAVPKDQSSDEPIKGIHPRTLGTMREFLTSHSEEYLSSEEISKSVGLSRITVRRYLNYLLENGEIVSIVDYATGGRPSLRYRISK